MEWHVYILLCADGSFYVGHTDDLDARVKAHNQGHGAAHTYLRRPVVLVYIEHADSRPAASERERQLKRWSRAKKRALIMGDLSALKRLSRCRNY